MDDPALPEEVQLNLELDFIVENQAKTEQVMSISFWNAFSIYKNSKSTLSSNFIKNIKICIVKIKIELQIEPRLKKRPSALSVPTN